MAKYTWKAGDDLFALAKKYKTTSSAILEANPGLRSPLPGIVLTIPAVTGGSWGYDPTPKTTPGTGLGGQTRKGGTVPAPITIPPKFTSPPGGVYRPTPGGKGVVPPVAPPPAPPAQNWTQSVYGTPQVEPSRVGGVRQTGLPPAGQAQQVVPPGVGVGAGIPRGSATSQNLQQFNQAILPVVSQRIQGYLDTLYRRWAPTARNLLYQGAENLENIPRPGLEGRGREPGSFNLPAMALRGMAGRVGTVGPGQGTPSGWSGMPPEAARRAALEQQGNQPFTGLYQQRFGIPTVGGEAQGYILGNFRDEQGNLIPFDEATKANVARQKARNKTQLLNLGERPMFISNSERLMMGLSEEDIRSIGYEWDEDSQQWIHSNVIDDGPQVAGTAAPYGYGGGGYYGYPKSGYGGGGYGYPIYGGGGGGVEINFPEGGRTAVDQQRRGVSPQQRRNQPARFGVISWRI